MSSLTPNEAARAASSSSDGAAAKAFEAWLKTNDRAETRPDYWFAGFRAALDAVEAKMPGADLTALENNHLQRGRAGGWNRCLSVMSERISELRPPPSQPGQPSERGTA